MFRDTSSAGFDAIKMSHNNYNFVIGTPTGVFQYFRLITHRKLQGVCGDYLYIEYISTTIIRPLKSKRHIVCILI